MARVPYLTPEDLPETERDLVARNITLEQALVHSPGGSRVHWEIARWIRYDTKLDPRLRELVILQVGYVTRSRYEFSHHLKIWRELRPSLTRTLKP